MRCICHAKMRYDVTIRIFHYKKKKNHPYKITVMTTAAPQCNDSCVSMMVPPTPPIPPPYPTYDDPLVDVVEDIHNDTGVVQTTPMTPTPTDYGKGSPSFNVSCQNII